METTSLLLNTLYREYSAPKIQFPYIYTSLNLLNLNDRSSTRFRQARWCWLTTIDPFYSPLLSRLDAVFSRLGHTTEGCREYAVCAMYRSPARYAPYSNLVSAQLSRELNELRRPSSDNPDVLRFFRYMKAAKDGQDGVKCEDAYTNCAVAREDETLRQNQAILATYQDIDKLVHARKL